MYCPVYGLVVWSCEVIKWALSHPSAANQSLNYCMSRVDRGFYILQYSVCFKVGDLLFHI